MTTPNPHPGKQRALTAGSIRRRTIGRIALGAALLFTGIAHVSFARATFVAQVPAWVPLSADFVVVASGVVELALGAALIVRPQQQAVTGMIVALFFLAIFPGNISQTLSHIDAFGLNSDAARIIRLFFQPLLMLWALWSTGAWRAIVARALR